MLDDIERITRQAPWRHMVTPGGKSMSVANSNCGEWGWVSDAHGYRYVPDDPLTGQRWPAIPAHWQELARRAKQQGGFEGTPAPDACLLNRYAPGARLSLHQDRDERDFGAPIISISLGLPAVFLWGGDKRSDPYRTLTLTHGDVLLWGGVDRLRYHGVRPVAHGLHPRTQAFRFNITMRKAT
ncbi:Alpha-ketoglutarate-dependent dioxygenase AlkB [bioreactor metagenome]|uniref:Alpha-ketoglutarate-dependent dioxygenase AlkB n=1 Tax=bioreactor metagenome TaxID=1076179 RepID=A0A645FQT2_9ZZZZ